MYNVDNLDYFTVLYRDAGAKGAEVPLCFVCRAENFDHAEEQCENAYPGCEIVWVAPTKEPQAAYDDYHYFTNE
jgi:hypothetical protein